MKTIKLTDEQIVTLRLALSNVMYGHRVEQLGCLDTATKFEKGSSEHQRLMGYADDFKKRADEVKEIYEMLLAAYKN